MIAISTFYRFINLTPEQIQALEKRLETVATAENLKGLCLLGREGINCTISGFDSGIAVIKEAVRTELATPDILFKDSWGPKHPFQVFKVKVKSEIVTIGKPGLAPAAPKNNHLSPSEWRDAARAENTILLDTRNDYEVQVGKFKGALDLQLEEFAEFPEKLRNSGLNKDTTILTYCTGGIRCEKAILEMREQGYHNVFQLEGGILNYLKEFPEQDFEGECFVFDYRIAVNQNLKPTSRYALCPHCGQPAQETIQCVKCARHEVICGSCRQDGIQTCSKNCAHHAAIGSGSTKTHVPELIKRHRVAGQAVD